MLSCVNPTSAWQDMYTVTETGAHPVIFSWNEVERHFAPGETSSDRFRPISIPCGKCLLCRKRRAQEIAIRALFEIRGYSPDQFHSFVTLTVDDEHLEEIFPSSVVSCHDVDGRFLDKRLCPRLQHRPFQLFMKRLRKRGVNVRYLMCGEYGEQTHRPHYHAILFGWYPLDSYFDDFGCYHGSKSLEELWPFGHVMVDCVNSNRVFYVAGYTLKGNALKQPEWEPYVKWSRCPGLGAKYIDEHGYKDMVKKDLQWFQDNKFETWYYRTFIGRNEVRFGSRYFDGRLALQDQERFDKIKVSRLSRVQLEAQKLVDSPELAALAARSLMNKAKSLDYQLARKSRELR